MVEAEVQNEMHDIQEQAAQESRDQQEQRKGRLIEPYPAAAGQFPSDASTTLQVSRQWER